ncbi:YqjF family protein [Foetidibacter luteolus]|uniref:YqjF family protein n=1 Tax=Foetidibacter luteolus TaxID=2608880 RepID=UPI00129A9CC7|nr:DUF2071 domain-containing protein [Foetidibacter luteolus]
MASPVASQSVHRQVLWAAFQAPVICINHDFTWFALIITYVEQGPIKSPPNAILGMEKAFLSAEWKNLVFANYQVPEDILIPYVPAGTELDLYNGKCFVSLVGFMFSNTRLYGVKIPAYQNFEEFNLRFYVVRNEGENFKRGVVFIKEIVPRRMIARVARWLYDEHYVYCKMNNTLHQTADELTIQYGFRFNGDWNYFQATTGHTGALPLPGSEEEFITEHYWGYTKQGKHLTSEYKVQHPPWEINNTTNHDIRCNIKDLYGEAFNQHMKKPSSVFVSTGSAIKVFPRKLLRV